MKIESKELPNSRRQYLVSIDEKEVDAYFERAVGHLAREVKISGFRPGKAPKNLARQNLDETKLREEAYALVVRASWWEITKQLATSNLQTSRNSRQKGQKPDTNGHQQVLPIQDPEVTLEHFEEGKAAKLVFAFDVRPEVKVGDWKKIKVQDSGLKSGKVSDQEVAELIDSLRRAHAKEVIKLTPAMSGDKVHVNFQGSVGGVRQDKMSSKNFPLIIGRANTIPGFDAQLTGLKKGDKKQFQLQFPADHFDKQLANQAVDFAAEIEEVFEIILPELNREFAEKFGHKTVEQLQKAIALDIGRRKAEEQFVTQKAKWLAEFEKLVDCGLPATLIDAEITRSREAWRKFLQERHINEGDWLSSRKLTLEQLEKDWHKAAEASVKIGLGLAEVAKAMKKELKSNEEFQELLDELVKKAIK